MFVRSRCFASKSIACDILHQAAQRIAKSHTWMWLVHILSILDERTNEILLAKFTYDNYYLRKMTARQKKNALERRKSGFPLTDENRFFAAWILDVVAEFPNARSDKWSSVRSLERWLILLHFIHSVPILIRTRARGHIRGVSANATP